MAIQNDEEFESKLTQLCRMYRALREIWAQTNVSQAGELQKWVITGGSVIEKTTELLAELEDYTGGAELRLILMELQAMKRDRAAADRT